MMPAFLLVNKLKKNGKKHFQNYMLNTTIFTGEKQEETKLFV